MTYQEIERYISEIPKFTKKHSLSHTKRFLEILQIPQGKMKILHVAGTNGKGSVCAYLDAMLRSEGKRTGLFISPHLVKMNERIMIDGVPVSDEVFSEVFTQTLGAVKQMEAEGLEHPTFFEFLFGMGMLAFSQAEAEYVILETGLGGRLDATSATELPVRKPGSSVPVFRSFMHRVQKKVTESLKRRQHSREVPVKKSGKMRTKFLESKTNILLFPARMLIMELPRGN